MAYRIDVSKIDGVDIDANGFMTARAKLTRTGVFPYLMYDGTISYELRHPDDVFDAESLKSAKSQVITNDHPPGMLYCDNAKDYQVGFTGEIVDIIDNKFLESNIKITCDKTINDITQGGKKEISEGYRCDVIDEKGMYEGLPYNKRQKNIRYNHASVVWEGRAGSEVSIKTDAADKDFGVMKLDSENNTCQRQQVKVQLKDNKDKNFLEKTMVKIKIDGVEYEVSETAAQAMQLKLDALKASQLDVESAKTLAIQAEAKADAFKSEVAKRDSEIEQLKKDFNDDAILARADSLYKIKSFAKEILGEDKTDSIEEIKRAVVAKLTKVDCSKKDSAYVDVAFDTLASIHKSDFKTDAFQKVVSEGKDEAPTTAEKARKDHIEKLIADSNK